MLDAFRPLDSAAFKYTRAATSSNCAAHSGAMRAIAITSSG